MVCVHPDFFPPAERTTQDGALDMYGRHRVTAGHLEVGRARNSRLHLFKGYKIETPGEAKVKEKKLEQEKALGLNSPSVGGKYLIPEMVKGKREKSANKAALGKIDRFLLPL